MNKYKSILLVEDDAVDVMTLKRVFRKIAVENPLHVCSDGEKALDWLSKHRKEKPGLILLDLNMPRMNGLEFLRTLKEDEDLRVIPVVVLTTSADPNDRAESFLNNAAGYMLKSIDYQEFIHNMTVIRDYWRQSELSY